MDARPLLETIARVLEEAGLEAILIGNAAAALHGAPVTTVDFDFFIGKTPHNLEKLKAVAKALDAISLQPHYPVSGLFRVMRDDDGLQLDFMTTIHGVKSFAALRAQSSSQDFGAYSLIVADLEAVLASKRAAGRPRDKAVLDTLEKALHETQARKPKAKTRRSQGGK
jgi:predicted nucleotidyltransferase